MPFAIARIRPEVLFLEVPDEVKIKHLEAVMGFPCRIQRWSSDGLIVNPIGSDIEAITAALADVGWEQKTVDTMTLSEGEAEVYLEDPNPSDYFFMPVPDAPPGTQMRIVSEMTGRPIHVEFELSPDGTVTRDSVQ